MRARIVAKTPVKNRESSVSRIKKTDHVKPFSSPVDRVLFLQRTIGNQAVQGLIKSGLIRTKLKIGHANDVFEQEADRVAEAMMRIPEPKVQQQPEEEDPIQTKPLAEQITPLVQRQMEEEKELIQTQGDAGQTPEVALEPEPRIQSLRGVGQPLPASVRAFFEPRFGYDFSQVRIHTDAQAAEMAKAVNAKVFTTERDVVFGAGQYSPETSVGKRLLAHELTHVVQQNVMSKVAAETAKPTHSLTSYEGGAIQRQQKNKSKKLKNTSPTGVYVAYVPLSWLPKWIPTNVVIDHAFIELDDGSSYGFTYDERLGETIEDARICDPEPRHRDPRKKLYVTERKDDAVSQSKTSVEIKLAIKSFALTDNPGQWRPVTNNCGDWVKRALDACWLKPKTPHHIY